MSTQPPFTIEQFYKFMSEGKLMARQMPQMRKNPPAPPTHLRQLL